MTCVLTVTVLCLSVDAKTSAKEVNLTIHIFLKF